MSYHISIKLRLLNAARHLECFGKPVDSSNLQSPRSPFGIEVLNSLKWEIPVAVGSFYTKKIRIIYRSIPHHCSIHIFQDEAFFFADHLSVRRAGCRFIIDWQTLENSTCKMAVLFSIPKRL